MSFEARYAGVCAACGQRIKPGQRVEGGGETLAHVTCPEPRPMCPTCFTEKSVNDSCLCG